ncbi:hypothetical protein OH77DRAFT_1458632 [Trametes cingulata]|nr:hypothetical protein OH77DRAFT_1458632 [Trametes cingulata]
MVKFYDKIPDDHIAWIHKQHMFFVATAPLTGDGHVNLSPKGIDGTLHVESNTRIWYEDLSGSGVETIAHLRENGRITVMFCAFEGAARIMRLFGRGTVHEFGTPEYDALIPPSARRPSSRAAIVIDVYRVSTSCGYAVPLYTFKAERSALTKWGERMEERDRAFPPRPVSESADSENAPVSGDAGASGEKTKVKIVTVDTEAGPRLYAEHSMKHWWASMNLRSLDGLPGLHSAHLTDATLETGIAVKGVDEPPSDGTVVILGNKVPKGQTGLAVGRLRVGKDGGLVGAFEALAPQSREEAVRLVWVFVLGLVAASAYGRVIQSVSGRLGYDTLSL